MSLSVWSCVIVCQIMISVWVVRQEAAILLFCVTGDDWIYSIRIICLKSRALKLPSFNVILKRYITMEIRDCVLFLK